MKSKRRSTPANLLPSRRKLAIFCSASLISRAMLKPIRRRRSAGPTPKFELRFRFVEDALAAKGMAPGAAALAEMETLWNMAKQSEKQVTP